MRDQLRLAWRRNGSVLLWTPILLASPLLNVDVGSAVAAAQVGLVAVMAGCAITVVLTGHHDRRATPYVALSTQIAVTFGGAPHGAAWLPTWTLLALTLPSVLRGRWLAAGVSAAAAGTMWASWLNGSSAPDFVVHGLLVLLAGVANSIFLRLLETIDELHRTRQELARRAVAEERERFSRDLHDLLGHTLSVMVVKAQAVRRLMERDPGAAATHAEDIERVGRNALLEVRQAVDSTRTASLDDELAGARSALDAAGIQTEAQLDEVSMATAAEQALAWVVRESATNVIRHSGASRCRFDLRREDGMVTLTVADDGVGGPAAPADRQGGLDGLRRRVSAVGGRLEVDPDADGFRLTARVPQTVAGR